MATNQSPLRRAIDRRSRRLALCDQLAALFADDPETLGLAVDALVCLPPSTVPWIDIVLVPIDLGLGSLRHSVYSPIGGLDHDLSLESLSRPRKVSGQRVDP